MGKRKKLTKKQMAIIDDLFAGELDEQEVLDKHKVSRNLYDRWLTDERFVVQFKERIDRAYRQSELIIARYAPLAAAKLVALTTAENPETARKACLDIISFPGLAPQFTAGSVAETATAKQSGQVAQQLSPQTASRLLAALAEETDDRKKG